MIKDQILQELKDLISAYFESQGVELIDLILRYKGKNLILKILVDSPQGGITLGECALLNRQLGLIFEEQNIIDRDYILEVSSPGLDRDLKTQKDFLRCLNKEVVFFLNDLINGKCQWQGLVGRVDETSVFIQSSKEALEIPLIKINKAKLVIE